MPIHVAITRRVIAGKEQEFQKALRQFLGESFIHGGVQGAGMMLSLPGAHERDVGILRTFADEAQRDGFYASQLYKDWEDYASTLTKGETVHRQLHGLEAWFRAPGAPPRWKMAVATFIGVYPTSVFLTYFLSGFIHPLPLLLKSFIIGGLMVAMLTWIVMPNVIKILSPWLHKSR